MKKQPLHMGSVRRRPDNWATAVLLVALVFTALFLGGDSSSEVAGRGTVGVGIGLAGFFLLELRHTWRNLFRADLLALVALYFLSLFEFLFDQTAFARRVSPELAIQGVHLVLWGFVAIAVGRHLTIKPSRHVTRLMRQPTPPGIVIGFFWFCMAIGYLYMLVAVNFNLVVMVEYMFEPRFRRPWGRGYFGDWNALLHELGLFKNLVPPLAGVVIARYKRYSNIQVAAVGAGCLFVLFDGFASGTRNTFGVYLATFLVGYSFGIPRHQWKRAAILSGIGALLMYWATSIMLAFRNVGLGQYLEEPRSRYLQEESGIFVDYNLQMISRIAEAFPSEFGYLGLEVPYQALVRPIPRAIWSGKPEGLSVSIEEVIGAEGWTVATTFIGEAYMSGGVLGIIIIGMVIGGLASWWSQHLDTYNSDLGILIYASGLFAFLIGMRSMLWITTGMLPALGAVVIGLFLMRYYTGVRAKVKTQ